MYKSTNIPIIRFFGPQRFPETPLAGPRTSGTIENL